MPRKPRAATKQLSAFSDAIAFCASILSDKGTISETHLRISNGQATAFNGTLAIGIKCESDITACPQSRMLTEALSKCGQQIAITQLDNRLSIRSDKFRAFVPCIDPVLLSTPTPDAPQVDVDDKLKTALSIAGELANENSERINDVSVLLDQGSVISSMGSGCILQYWHGFNLSPSLSIPKALCSRLAKINKPLAKFGCNQFSCTFYFTDGSWLKSQLYADRWPDVSSVFECQHDLQPFPVDFWDALAAVAPFGEGLVYWDGKGRLSSHAQEGAGASFDLPGYRGSSWCFPARQLALLKAFSVADFQAQGLRGPVLYAASGMARAIIAGVRR